MKFTVNARDFRDALKGCEKHASNDASRPAMQFVQLIAKDGKITLTALDGFRMVQYTLAAAGEIEPGEALINPKLALSTLRATKGNVTATVAIDAGTMSMTTDITVSAAMPTPDGPYPDHSKVWPDPTHDCIRIGFNAVYLAELAQALGAVSKQRRGAIWLEVPTNPVLPMLITARGETLEARGIVCPVRERA